MKRVAWVTHRPWDPENGGAEAADRDMVIRKPSEVEVTVMWPGGVAEDIVDFDAVVVTGWYAFTSLELNTIAQAKPYLWVHDVQMSGHWLYEDARKVICLTPAHAEYEKSKIPSLSSPLVNPGFLDPEEVFIHQRKGQRKLDALWAHRPVPGKGLDLASQWAQDHGQNLTVMVGRPRHEVLEAMWLHNNFVLLPHEFDPGPRAILEAQLAECNLVINEEVGWFDMSTTELANLVSQADKIFWDWVLN